MAAGARIGVIDSQDIPLHTMLAALTGLSPNLSGAEVFNARVFSKNVQGLGWTSALTTKSATERNKRNRHREKTQVLLQGDCWRWLSLYHFTSSSTRKCERPRRQYSQRRTCANIKSSHGSKNKTKPIKQPRHGSRHECLSSETQIEVDPWSSLAFAQSIVSPVSVSKVESSLQHTQTPSECSFSMVTVGIGNFEWIHAKLESDVFKYLSSLSYFLKF